MAEQLPARLDRAALERIIQRAAELQTADRDIGEHLTEDEVLALGKEVGIPTRYLQQALIEERGRVAPGVGPGVIDRVVGPGTLAAQRVLLGAPDALGETLCAYFDEHELLCVQRRQAGRISWEPLKGFQAAIRRSSAAFGGRKLYMLDKAETVSAVFTPLEEGFTHVLLTADVRNFRGQFVGGGIAVATLGAASSGVLFALGAFAVAAVAPLPLALGLGYGLLRQYPPKLQRLQLGLERALDHLEQGAAKPSHQLPPSRTAGLLGMIVDEVKKNLK
jgi:hypothetical protein